MLLRTQDSKTLEIIKSAPAELIVYAVRLMDAEKDTRFADAQGAMRQFASERIVDALNNEELWTSVAPLGMYIAVLAAWQPDQVRERVMKLLEGHPERAKMLLAARIDAALKMGAAVMKPATISYGQLKQEVDTEKLYEIVNADAGKNPEHVEWLRKAIDAEAAPAS